MERPLTEVGDWSEEMSFTSKDGSEGICEMHVSPLFDDNGHITAWVGVNRDITDRKQMMEQLTQARKMDALGRLTGGVAHDFNNLLTVIDGFSKMALRKTSDVERVESCLGEVIKASEKAARLTSQLLAFSRKHVLEPRVVNLEALVRELESLLEPLLGETINLRIKISDEDIWVEVDPSQLSQAIMNLAINSRDAMPRGGLLLIEVDSSEVDEARAETAGVIPGTYASVTVKDGGVGMDEATLKNIFEPFFTTKEPGRGAGLGLSMVYGMVKQSRGFLDIESAPGRGTAAAIYLRRVDRQPEIGEEGPALDPGSGNAETILIVEDEDAVRELAKMTLEEMGYDVLTACNGGDAIEIHKAYTGRIDLLLTDIVMPGWGGPEVARSVTEDRPDTKVIYMSGYPSRGRLHRYEIGPEVPFVQKPFDPTNLGRMVRQLLLDG